MHSISSFGFPCHFGYHRALSRVCCATEETLASYLFYTSLSSSPTPVFLPGESQGQRNPVGCRLLGRVELDTTEVT